MSLMLRLTKNLHGAGGNFMLYDGLYVLQGLVDINKKGVCESSLIKKSRYWPIYIDDEKSRLTSPTRVLSPWMHFMAILKMCIFMSYL